MNREIVWIVLAVAGFAGPVLGQTTATSQPAAATEPGGRVLLSKGEIARAVEGQRRGIETLSVSFHSSSDVSGDERAHYAANVVIRGHSLAGAATRPAGAGVAPGRQVMVDRHYGATEDRLFHQWIAFNGRFSCWYQEFNHLGGLLPGQNEYVDLRREPFFELNLLCDEARGGVSESASLTAILRDKFTTVRKRMERINERWCCVIDNGGWLHTDATLWLDPGRQYLPVRVKFFGARKTDVTEWDVEKAEEVAAAGGGAKFWFATEGRELLPGGAVVHVSVDRDGAGGPAIKVNEVLAADYFDLWKKMPVGTRVFNAQANRTFVVGDHGQLEDLSEGKELGGGEVSPDSHDTAAGPLRVGKVLAIAGVPVGFLVVSVAVLAVVGWVGMRRGESANKRVSE